MRAFKLTLLLTVLALPLASACVKRDQERELNPSGTATSPSASTVPPYDSARERAVGEAEAESDADDDVMHSPSTGRSTAGPGESSSMGTLPPGALPEDGTTPAEGSSSSGDFATPEELPPSPGPSASGAPASAGPGARRATPTTTSTMTAPSCKAPAAPTFSMTATSCRSPSTSSTRDRAGSTPVFLASPRGDRNRDISVQDQLRSSLDVAA